MSVNSTNWEREIKNIHAEISEMKSEIAFLYSSFQEVQEQFGFALAEINNSIKNFSSEVKREFKEFDNNLKNLKIDLQNNQSEKISDAVREVEKNFSENEKSLATQQKIFEEFFNQQNSNIDKKFNGLQKNFTEKISNVGEDISIVKKNISQFSSEVDEIFSDNQKNLMKKIDSVNDKPKDFYKTLNAIEELLRLIAANQMLADIQNEISSQNQNTNEKTSPQENSFFRSLWATVAKASQENYSSNSYSGGRKSISIYGRAGVGKTTLAIILKNQYSQFEILEISGVDKYEIKRDYIERDLAIFIIEAGYPNYQETQNFYNICKIAQKVLLVVNVRIGYALEMDPLSRRRQVANYFNNNSYISKNIYDMFRSRCPYGINWNKISVAYVNLRAAQIAINSHDRGLLTASNFSEIEKFINAV